MQVPVQEASLTAALMLGLLGSPHCLGMCGGIVSALSLSIAKKKKKFLAFSSLLVSYNLGRLISYSIAGLLFGLLGATLKNHPTAVTTLRILSAVMLIAMGLYLANWYNVLTKVEKAGNLLWRYIQPIASRWLPVKTVVEAFIIGLFWGWLPCGLVYSTLIWAGSSGQWQQSSLLMLFFGLGTLPSMFLTGMAADKLREFIQARLTRQISGLMVILFGIWSLPGYHHKWLMKLLMPLFH